MTPRGITTEPFVRFLDFKRTFNSQFKVSIAAILHVSRVVSGPGGTRIMQGLVADTGEPWAKDFNWSDPAADLSSALRNTTLLGLVQVHSAADDMISALHADIDRWLAFSRQGAISSAAEDEQSDPLELTYTKVLNGSGAAFNELRPILRYFRLARNCIAHRSSSASPAFAAWSSSPLVDSALQMWPKRKDAYPPPLPRCAVNSPIELLPRHTILALEAIYRAADMLNRQLVHKLGNDGLTYLAVRHVLLGEAQVAGLTAHRSAQAIVADALANRYRMPKVKGNDVIPDLKRLGIWKECLQAFAHRHGQTPKTSIKAVATANVVERKHI